MLLEDINNKMVQNSVEQTVYDYLNWELFGINPISSL